MVLISVYIKFVVHTSFNDNMRLLEFLCNVCSFVQHSLLAELYRDVIQGVCCRIWATTTDAGVDQNVQGCSSTL